MNATDIIGWTYDADVHCEACAEARFPSLHDDENPPADSEGNEVHPMFAGDDHSTDGESVHCGDCGSEIVEESYDHARSKKMESDLIETTQKINGEDAYFAIVIKLRDIPRNWDASQRPILAQVLRDLADKADRDGINLETGNLWADGLIVGESAVIDI